MAIPNHPLAASVAQLALKTFDHKLPKKCKPRTFDDVRREWTPLSAIVLKLPKPGDYSAGSTPEDASNALDASSLKIISLATGTKCLPSSAMPKCDGAVLHDCHAEVLAFRGFNLWLLQESKRILGDESFVSAVLEQTSTKASGRPFRLKPGVEIFLFSTEAPCGDASMELLMSSNSSNSSEAWSSESLATDLQSGIPLGRGHFSHLGVMRRKPARGDAEPSLSMSCSDKISLKQILGVLSFPVDLLVETTEECFLKGLVVYEDQYSLPGYTRAFGCDGRLIKVGDAHSRLFETYTLNEKDMALRFAFDKPREAGATLKVSNVSALWVSGASEGLAIIEVLVGGVKQGYRQFDDRTGKRSCVSRRQMFQQANEVLQLIHLKRSGIVAINVQQVVRGYQGYKCIDQREIRNNIKARAKELLGGWKSRSDEDDPVFTCARRNCDCEGV